MTDGGVMDHEDMPGSEADREPDPSDSLRTFGAVMQALREHAGYSRTEFADLVSFSKHTVESVELGRRMPDVALVERSEEALGNTGALRVGEVRDAGARGCRARGVVPAVGSAGAGGGEPVHV
jgi:DNA-binding XRE family transcriptional regulator